MMIWDCFLYNGERELLDIRLHELSKCKEPVTHILIEAAYTFSGKEKPLYFGQIKEEYAEWPIISVTVERFPETENPWDRERYQRNLIKPALNMMNPSDDNIVIIGDVDEIVMASVVDEFKGDFASLCMNKYAYYLNGLEAHQGWDRCRIMKWSYLKDKNPEEVRNSGYPESIPNSGFHFSWLHNRADEKLKSFSHIELDTPEFRNSVIMRDAFWNDTELQYTEIEPFYPEYIRNNIEKFKHLIK